MIDNVPVPTHTKNVTLWFQCAIRKLLGSYVRQYCCSKNQPNEPFRLTMLELRRHGGVPVTLEASTQQRKTKAYEYNHNKRPAL